MVDDKVAHAVDRPNYFKDIFQILRALVRQSNVMGDRVQEVHGPSRASARKKCPPHLGRDACIVT